MCNGTTPQDIIHASHAADSAWQAALVRTYGKRARDARYDDRGTATPVLMALYLERAAASDAERAMWGASVCGRYEGPSLQPLHNAHVAAFHAVNVGTKGANQ